MPAPTGDQFRQFLDALSPNSPFIKVHRGMWGVTPKDLDTNRLGSHWTTNATYAEDWTDPVEQGWLSEPAERQPGLIISGLIHKKHIIPENTPEWNKHQDGSFGYENEEELLVRPNARVHVTQIEQTNPDGSKKVIATRGSKEAPLRGFRA